jgi:hypothetical protein
MQRIMDRCFGIRDDPERQSNWYYVGWYVTTNLNVGRLVIDLLLIYVRNRA